MDEREREEDEKTATATQLLPLHALGELSAWAGVRHCLCAAQGLLRAEAGSGKSHSRTPKLRSISMSPLHPAVELTMKDEAVLGSHQLQRQHLQSTALRSSPHISPSPTGGHYQSVLASLL
ncbi:hypothetical protein C0Q70_06265 [Pomacea canaliculata]|uniref:Uncharacterized protein n=1 Tax=Pomacea canaliculata TaxID=400727 RepID=A0A2T7PNH6_POMCA|nr:hypothetical protein C0Q70_06265 [Pomacea canaliculata]